MNRGEGMEFGQVKQLIPDSTKVFVWEIRAEDDVNEVDLGLGINIKKTITDYEKDEVDAIYPIGDGVLAISIDFR